MSNEIETQGRKVILTDFIEIVIIELPKIYRLNENEKDNKLLDWLYFLENPSSEKVKKIMEENEGVKEAREKLEEISDDIIMQRLADYRESAIWEEKAARRTATRKGLEEGMKKGLKQGMKQGMEQGIKEGMEQGIKEGMEQGIKEGMKQGIKEGRAEGRKEGRKSEKIELAKKMKNKGFSIQEIIDITELSKEEVEKI